MRSSSSKQSHAGSTKPKTSTLKSTSTSRASREGNAGILVGSKAKRSTKSSSHARCEQASIQPTASPLTVGPLTRNSRPKPSFRGAAPPLTPQAAAGSRSFPDNPYYGRERRDDHFSRYSVPLSGPLTEEQRRQEAVGRMEAPLGKYYGGGVDGQAQPLAQAGDAPQQYIYPTTVELDLDLHEP